TAASRKGHFMVRFPLHNGEKIRWPGLDRFLRCITPMPRLPCKIDEERGVRVASFRETKVRSRVRQERGGRHCPAFLANAATDGRRGARPTVAPIRQRLR